MLTSIAWETQQQQQKHQEQQEQQQHLLRNNWQKTLRADNDPNTNKQTLCLKIFLVKWVNKVTSKVLNLVDQVQTVLF